MPKYNKVDEIPFDFSRRRLSIIVNDGTKDKSAELAKEYAKREGGGQTLEPEEKPKGTQLESGRRAWVVDDSICHLEC